MKTFHLGIPYFPFFSYQKYLKNSFALSSVLIFLLILHVNQCSQEQVHQAALKNHNIFQTIPHFIKFEIVIKYVLSKHTHISNSVYSIHIKLQKILGATFTSKFNLQLSHFLKYYSKANQHR